MKTTLLLPAALLFTAATALAAHPPEPIPGLPMPSRGTDSPTSEEVARRLAATRHLAVPVPKKTGFDANRVARRVYLEAYRVAYRQAAAGFLVYPEYDTNAPHFEARSKGHSDGVRAAWEHGLLLRNTIGKPK